MELNNYPGVLRTYQQSVTVESGDDLLIDQHQFDPTTNHNTVRRTLLQDGSRRTFRFSVRMFTFPEIRAGYMKPVSPRSKPMAMTGES